MNRILFMAPGWSFWRVNHWRWGTWYIKASKLYWKVYTRYLRTCALCDVISADKTVVKPPVLERLLAKIDDMIQNQNNNIYLDINARLSQYGRLNDANKILIAANVDYANQVPIITSLANISQQFMSINTQFQQGNVPSQPLQQNIQPANDPVRTYLDQAKGIVEELIRKEKSQN